MTRWSGYVFVLAGVLFVAAVATQFAGCNEPSSDRTQQQQQERILAEGTAAVGMPAIKNFREKRILKDILELRDQEGLVTYAYLFSEYTGRLTFLGETIGFPVPYATQFTNPQKLEYTAGGNRVVLPQADPNGLFSPASAEGTWLLMKDPNGGRVLPVYVETRVIVSPFRLRVPTSAEQP